VIQGLSGVRSFKRLRAQGVRAGRGPLRLVFRVESSDAVRVAFAIPRSVGNAVVRNRTKRRIRAVMQEMTSATPPCLVGGDYLVRVTNPIDSWSHATLRTTMTELLRSEDSLDGSDR